MEDGADPGDPEVGRSARDLSPGGLLDLRGGQSCFYRWREKYEGLRVDEARRLKELQDENRRLKQLLANRGLELDSVQRVLRKNSLGHTNGGRR